MNPPLEPPIETLPQEVVVAGHRFEVWVRVFEVIAASSVKMAVDYQAGKRARANPWRPFSEQDAAHDIESSILNGANIGVRYLGPVAK